MRRNRCEFIDMHRHDRDRSFFINQSTFVPEYIYGVDFPAVLPEHTSKLLAPTGSLWLTASTQMMSPFSPRRNGDLSWHTYSSQAYSIYHGDLDFYFGGWDGRGRVEKIDTAKCPVYMLTGDFDWSNTPEMSEKTASKIPGAQFATMKGIGHFPAAENSERFVKYLVEAVDWVMQRRG